jgi:hypothetical protein
MTESVGAVGFRLIVVRGDLDSLGLRDYAGAVRKLEAASRADPLFTLELDGIARYHWDSQTITLTAAATAALAGALERAGDRAAFAPLDAMKAKLGWGTAIERALYLRGFICVVDGQTRYGGIFLEAVSQRPIDFPVARVGLAPDGAATFSLLPVHLPFQARDPIKENGTFRSVRPPEAADERLPGPLEEMIASLAAGQPAASFRRAIRSPDIRSVLAGAGKLHPDDGP